MGVLVEGSFSPLEMTCILPRINQSPIIKTIDQEAKTTVLQSHTHAKLYMFRDFLEANILGFCCHHKFMIHTSFFEFAS